jgi:hypothetical protein
MALRALAEAAVVEVVAHLPKHPNKIPQKSSQSQCEKIRA